MNKYLKMNYNIFLKIKFTRFDIINFNFQYGKLKSKWNKIFNLFILGVRENLIIFNIDYTLYNLKKACQLIYQINYLKGVGLILWSNLIFYKNLFNFYKKIFKKKIKFSYYQGNYYGGLISNFNVFKEKRFLENATFNFKDLRRKNPSFSIIGDSLEFFYIFKECSRKLIPSVSLIDSDLEYRDITYPIPANINSIIGNYFFIHIFILLIRKGLIQRYKEYNERLYKILCLIIKLNIYLNILKYKKIFLIKKFFKYENYSKNFKYLLLKNMKFLFFCYFIFFFLIIILKFRINWSSYYKTIKINNLISNTFLTEFLNFFFNFLQKNKKIKIIKMLRLFFKMYIKGKKNY